MQVVSAGGFNVHNTEGAEANHKHCMRLASLRVRHLHEEQTKSSMLDFLSLHLLFTELRETPTTTHPERVNFSHGVRIPVLKNGVPICMRPPRYSFTNTGLQADFIHQEVLIARHELLDLVCDRFSMPKSLISYKRLDDLSWEFGHKFIR
jgi:hypothetical protein